MERLYQSQNLVNGLLTRFNELKKGVLVYNSNSLDEFFSKEETLPLGWEGVAYIFINDKVRIRDVGNTNNAPKELDSLFHGYDMGFISSYNHKEAKPILIKPELNIKENSEVSINNCLIMTKKHDTYPSLIGYDYPKPKLSVLHKYIAMASFL